MKDASDHWKSVVFTLHSKKKKKKSNKRGLLAYANPNRVRRGRTARLFFFFLLLLLFFFFFSDGDNVFCLHPSYRFKA